MGCPTGTGREQAITESTAPQLHPRDRFGIDVTPTAGDPAAWMVGGDEVGAGSKAGSQEATHWLAFGLHTKEASHLGSVGPRSQHSDTPRDDSQHLENPRPGRLKADWFPPGHAFGQRNTEGLECPCGLGLTPENGYGPGQTRGPVRRGRSVSIDRLLVPCTSRGPPPQFNDPARRIRLQPSVCHSQSPSVAWVLILSPCVLPAPRHRDKVRLPEPSKLFRQPIAQPDREARQSPDL
jgi:hypothetical protein